MLNYYQTYYIFIFKSVPYMLQIRKWEHANMRNKDGANH